MRSLWLAIPLMLGTSMLGSSVLGSSVLGCSAPRSLPPPPAAPSDPFLVPVASPFETVGPCRRRPESPTPEWVEERLRESRSPWVADELTADLDGNGVPERVRVRHHQAQSDVTVSIGSTDRWLYSGMYARPGLIDLDPQDNAREVVLGTRIGGGIILRYQDERIVALQAESRSLTSDEPGVSPRRVSFAVLGDDIVIVAELDGKVLRAKLPAYACQPSLGVIEVALDSSDSNAQRHWLVSLHNREDDPLTYLLLAESPDGLEGFGPFLGANSFDVSGGAITLTHWDCGRRSVQVWKRAPGAGFVKTTTSIFGRRDRRSCGRVQLMRDDLDGDGRSDDIVVGRGFLLVNGARAVRPGDREALQIVDAGNGRKDLVFSDPESEDETTRVVYTYDGARLHSSTRAPSNE